MSYREQVLLVDSDSERVDGIKATLVDGEGYHVHVVPTLNLALDVLLHARHPSAAPSFVLSALKLADCMGPEVVLELKAAAPEVPLVILADFLDRKFEEQLFHLGAEEVVSPEGWYTEDLPRALARANLRRTRAVKAVSNERNLMNVISSMEDAVLIVDVAQNVIFSNPTASRFLGSDRLELKGRKLDLPFQLGETREIDLSECGSEPRMCEVRASEMDWEGRPARLVTMRDVGDRRKAEDFRRRLIHSDRLAAIGQLASSVAHEVNTPAGYVLGNLSTLQRDWHEMFVAFKSVRDTLARTGGAAVVKNRGLWDGLSALEQQISTKREMVHESLIGMERIAVILKDLKNFSKIDREEIELVRLDEVAQAACSLVANQVKYQATLEKKLVPMPPVAAHKGRLIQVVTNLLINAGQSMTGSKARKGQIVVSTRKEGESLLLSVRDTGAGVPVEVRDRIFEPFFTTKGQGEGTGLGLSLCVDMIARHGGSIDFESEVGQGSTFTITLPRETGLKIETSKTPLPTPVPGQMVRILVVDDDHLFTRAVSRMLSNAHDIDVTHSGKEALQRLEKDSGYEIVLCDLMMSEMDGPELFQQCSRLYPSLVKRFVFLTGGAVTPHAKEFVSKVRNIVLDKPIDPDSLLTAIASVIEKNRQA